MNKDNNSSLHDLVITYGVAVVSVIAALGLGAYVIAGAIAMYADTTTTMPSIFSALGGNGYASMLTSGAIAIICGVITHLALKKITTSPKAGELVSSNSYQIINKSAKAVCFILAGLAIVGVVTVLLAALLSISKTTPWKSYLLGQCLPLIFTGAGFATAGVLINKFTKAEIKPAMLAMVAIIVAVVGFALASIAVIVDAHVTNSPTYNTFKSLYDYFE